MKVWAIKPFKMYSILSAIGLLPAVEISPCKSFFFLSFIIHLGLQSKETKSTIKSPALNERTSLKGRTRSWQKNIKKKNRTAGFAAFCMDDSHVLSCAWEWVMVTMRSWQSTTHMAFVSLWTVLSNCCHLLPFHHKSNIVWEHGNSVPLL